MSNRRSVYCLILIILLQSRAFAYETGIETAETRIDTLNERAYKLLHVNMSKTLSMLTDAEQLCIKSNYEKGLAVNYLYQGEVFYQRGYFKRATILFDHSLQLSRQIKDVYNVARAQEQISTIKKYEGMYASAEKLLNSSLSIYQQLHKPFDIINIQLKIGIIKQTQKRYTEALQIYNNAYLLSKQIHYLYGEKKTYFNQAYLYREKGDTDSAVYYYNKALKIDTLTNDIYGKALSYIGLSKVYLEKSNLNKAAYYANQAQTNADTIHAQSLLEESIEMLLNIATRKNDIPAVMRWQDRLLKISRETSEDDKNDAALFIEVLKNQQERQLAVQKEISGIQKVSETKTIILICFFIVMIIVIMLVSSISYSYKKAKAYARDLDEKNRLIEEHAHSVAMLNNKIVGQNTILEEDNNLKNKLLSVISHDLRHPLTNTKSILELVNLKLVSHEEAQHLFHQLEAQYSRVLNLLDNLLYWIKSQVHGDAVEKVEINLYQMLNSLIEEQKLHIQSKSLKVVNDVEQGLECYAEQELLKIIFRNLLSNAVKFTHNEGVVNFSSIEIGTEVKITVSDNGTGIDKKALARLNIEGHYTSKGTANEEGSGLGLMLIRDLIKKVNGNLQIESEPGVGSTFTVCLALVDELSLVEN